LEVDQKWHLRLWT